MTAPRTDRDHPRDELVAYLLGELDVMARAAVDGHLHRCAACRDELARLDAGLVATIEALPPESPSDDTWAAIAARVAGAPADAATGGGLARGSAGIGRDAASVARRSADGVAAPRDRQGRARQRRGGGWASGGLVASLALAGALGWWGLGQRQVALDVRAELAAARAVAASRTTELLEVVATLEATVGALSDEQASVAQWLSEGEVAVAAVAGADQALGTVLYRSDGGALVVMRDAPGPGRSLQAWGVAAGTVTSLGTFEGRVLEVRAAGFEAVAISLEPLGGSAAPTDVLGAAPRG